jgi:hypothetical protein
VDEPEDLRSDLFDSFLSSSYIPAQNTSIPIPVSNAKLAVMSKYSTALDNMAASTTSGVVPFLVAVVVVVVVVVVVSSTATTTLPSPILGHPLVNNKTREVREGGNPMLVKSMAH